MSSSYARRVSRVPASRSVYRRKPLLAMAQKYFGLFLLLSPIIRRPLVERPLDVLRHSEVGHSAKPYGVRQDRLLSAPWRIVATSHFRTTVPLPHHPDAGT